MEEVQKNESSVADLAAVVTPPRLTPSALAQLVASVAQSSDNWVGRVEWREGERWYQRLECEADYDVWLISWLPGQSTGLHDHGTSSGAFVVVNGVLEEWRPGLGASPVGPGQVRAFGTRYLHDVRNAGPASAVSVHVYSPPLSVMHKYELVGDDVQRLGTLFEEEVP